MLTRFPYGFTIYGSLSFTPDAEGDIEVSPGPKTKINRRTAKSRFISDLNTDASLAHSDPKELTTKSHVSSHCSKVAQGLFIITLRFTSQSLFDNPELLLERDELLERDDLLCEKYNVHVRSVKRWEQDYQHSRFTCSVDMDNAVNKELAKKYGVRAATINSWKKEAVLEGCARKRHQSKTTAGCPEAVGPSDPCKLTCLLNCS